MGALEKLTSSTAWGTVSAVAKDRLADALASGDTSVIVDLTSACATALRVLISNQHQETLNWGSNRRETNGALAYECRCGR